MLPEITHVIASLIANQPVGGRCLSVKEAVGLALASRPLRYGLSTEYALRRYRALKRGTVTLTPGRTPHSGLSLPPKSTAAWRPTPARMTSPPWSMSWPASHPPATSSRRSTPRSCFTAAWRGGAPRGYLYPHATKTAKATHRYDLT